MLNFLLPKENFLLLKVSPGDVSGLLLSIDSEKKLKLKKFWTRLEEAKSPWRFRWTSIKKIIVSVEPRFAFTTVIPLVLERENAEKPLESAELENLLAQAVSRVFNQHRQEAGRELGTDELDVILADSRVTNFRVNGHQIINPLGFKIKEVRIIFQMTFTTRQIFEELKRFLKNSGDFFFTETGRAEFTALNKANPAGVNLLILNDDKSYIYSADSSAVGKLISRRKLDWQMKDLWGAISENWLVSQATGRNLYFIFLQNKISSRVGKYFKKIFMPSLSSLLNKIDKLKLKGKIYIFGENSPLPLLEERRSAFGAPSLNEFLEKSGFALDSRKSFSYSFDIFSLLAPFFEFYYDKSNTEIDHWLRRRLQWLGSPH